MRLPWTRCLPFVVAALLVPRFVFGKEVERPTTLRVPLHIRVARCGGRPVQSRAWVDAHVRSAQKVFAPYGITLDVRIDEFRPRRCDLLGPRQRDTMAAHVAAVGDTVAVLVVRRVRDLDVPSYNLMGVHWHYHGTRAIYAGRRWVLLTARARPPVLAHEICHYFGLPHDARGGNLMTPGPSSPLWKRPDPPQPFQPRLSAYQAAQLRAAVVRYHADPR